MLVQLRYSKTDTKKRSTCFATLLQNELNSDVGLFIVDELNPSSNKSAGCCRLRKVVAESRDQFYFLQQNLHMLRILSALRQSCFAASGVTSVYGVTPA